MGTAVWKGCSTKEPRFDSHQETFDHVAMHVGQAVKAALKLEGQPGQAIWGFGVRIMRIRQLPGPLSPAGNAKAALPI